MICIGLPLQAAVRPHAELLTFGLYDPDRREYYALRDLLACGKRVIFRLTVRLINCRKIRIIITCGGSDGRANKIIDVITTPPRSSGTFDLEVTAQNRRPFDATQLLNACGYSCTAKQVHFCCDVVALG